MKKIWVLFLIILANISLHAQDLESSSMRLIDSLKTELGNTESLTIKTAILEAITEKYADVYPDSSFLYGEKALTLARETKDFETELKVLGFISEAHLFKGNYPKALEICLEAMRFQEINLPDAAADQTGIGPVYSILVQVFEHLGDFDKAKQYAEKMSDFGEKDIVGKAYGNFYMAEIYEKENMLDSAMIRLNMSYAIFDSFKGSKGDFYGIYPAWYNTRAYVYFKKGQDELGIEDLKKSLTLSSDQDYPALSANTYNDLAIYYKSINQLDSVVYFAQKGLFEANKIAYTPGILKASEILAEVYESRDLAKSYDYYKLATETRNSLYGAGNIQVVRDMILQNEQRQADLDAAELDYNNRIRLYLLLAGIISLLLIAFILYRNMKRSKAANLKLEETLSDLKSTQSQLIQSEKMASLGELTAGIAHEIQNPLNFVNNFSEVSEELVHELKEELDKCDIEEAKVISDDVIQNLGKINHHGNRASSIVKGMLEHSQTSSEVKVRTDINALSDEYLRLAYHGLRAKDKEFQSDFKTDFDEKLPTVNVIPQDIGRVLLNLINNAFWATSAVALAKEDSHQPLVTITTKLTANSQLLIAIKDNGPGITPEIKDKIFQPFFTTKPTGKGTGLGLSLAYDIVNAHGGELTLENGVNEGAVFIIKLPIA